MRKIILFVSILLTTAAFGNQTIKNYYVKNGSFMSASNEVYYKGLTKLITRDLKKMLEQQKCVKLTSRKKFDYFIVPKIKGISVQDDCSTSFWSGKKTCKKDSELIYIEHKILTTRRKGARYLREPEWSHSWTAVKKGTDLVEYARRVIRKDYESFNVCK